MRKLCAIILFSCFLLLLTFIDVEADCEGSFFADNSTYSKNLNSLFFSLASNVISNDGFYNTSTGEGINKVYGLALCGRGYEKQACVNCLGQAIQESQETCPNRMKSFRWTTKDNDNASCLVRYANHSVFARLELFPPHMSPNPLRIEEPKSLKIFRPEWEALANLTIQSATSAPENSSLVLKFYSVIRAEFTEFADVYMMMQCTPDILSIECNKCLTKCVLNFQYNNWGRQGGGCRLPSCYFRWDTYPIVGSSENMTRVSVISHGSTPPQEDTELKLGYEEKGKTIRNGTIAIIVVPTVINIFVFVVLFIIFDQRRKSYNKNINESEYCDSDGQSMLRFGLAIILSATNDFSPKNKLGQGGFGTVYKGILQNGQEIAVKRLLSDPGQGCTEFKNEVSILTKLQHKNLVKLLGFCNEEDEEILVYELVPNSSLDHFIFDEEKRSLLTWEVRFKIIEGVARGLLYLHEDSQLKIIHRDLKASNILLDADMNPKVADFGTARLFDTDETCAETRRIAGTRGYMAPEYLNHGQISAKSDVFSYGVMLLEMISGQRNNSFEEGLAAFAWKSWVEGKPETVIDPLLMENPRIEIIKLIQIGLLCVQEIAAKRPTMSSVIVWLGSETVTIPLPSFPAFARNHSQSENSKMSLSNNVSTELSYK
ncbi:putative cysteine-rich receptor-like protein kinase 39 [Raphanus sativus]|uniref:Cysteine-rich receptor-like protein kinase 39 n=1 Tax=Raphanus sativus TaxID=3726 RepID=A0A6J0L7M0_RAPSA|nr:putative cysteine-rich receptor-like protein kinase 39 [Raphanus sativus]KAJ4876401.1 putative cysteine-rich receptor-like protein kinase 39 [Raphanus sativus]